MTRDHVKGSGPDEDEQLLADVRALLGQAGVHPRDLSLTAEEQARVDASAAAALAQIIGSHPRRRLPRIHRWHLMTAVSVLVVGTIVAVGLVDLNPGSPSAAAAATPPMLRFSLDEREQETSSQAASEQLGRLADEAGSAADRGDGLIQLVSTAGWLLKTDEATGEAEASSKLVPTRTDQYTMPDGTVRSIESTGAPLDPRGRLSDLGELDEVSDETFDAGPQGSNYPLTLSTDPDELVHQLVPEPAECPSLTYCLVAQAELLNYSYVLPPALTRALWSALGSASVADRVEYLGETEDRLGRPAVAFRTPGPSTERKLIIYADPSSGQFLGSEEILTADSAELGLNAPAVLEFTALVRAERVAPESLPAAR